MTDTVVDPVAALIEKIQELTDRVEQLEAHQEYLEGEIVRLEGELGDVQSDVSDFDSFKWDMEDTSSQVAEHARILNTFEDLIDGLKFDVAELKEKAEKNEEQDD